MNEKMEKAFNKQINEELFSEYLYMAMAAWFDDAGLAGFAKWMRGQAMEEHYHAMKFYNTITERGGRVVFDEIKKPQKDWESPLDAFKAALEHEKHISSCIHKLMALAREENDFPSEPLLNWFVEEQIEEEATASDIVGKLELIGEGGKGGGLFMLDRELGARTFALPIDFFGEGE